MMNRYFFILFLFAIVSSAVSCGDSAERRPEEKELAVNYLDSAKDVLDPAKFDTIIDGKPVKLFWIENDSIAAAFTNYGGRLVGLWVPDQEGELTDVVVGMGSVEAFKESTEPYFGATIGRVGNRIAKGKFVLNDTTYNIPTNNNGNTLHGGVKGFQDVVWDGKKTNDSTLIFTYISPHMEQGFPGKLDVQVTYIVTGDQEVLMEYEAATDRPTPVNLTNHAFFNLNGEGSGTILNHELQIFANKFTPVNSGLIPTGEFKKVEGTPFDFTEAHTIGERIEDENEQLGFGKGYDHNFVLDKKSPSSMTKAATVIGDKSGIRMDIYTQEPGLQFYSGNFMNGNNVFKSGVNDDFRTAFALETQHFPDAPNQSSFPDIILEPGEKYHTVSRYSFSTTDE